MGDRRPLQRAGDGRADRPRPDHHGPSRRRVQSKAEMKTIPVKLGSRGYDIKVGAGLLDQAGDLARAAAGEKSRQAIVISNPGVSALYGTRLSRSLKRAGFAVRQTLVS